MYKEGGLLVWMWKEDVNGLERVERVERVEAIETVEAVSN